MQSCSFQCNIHADSVKTSDSAMQETIHSRDNCKLV